MLLELKDKKLRIRHPISNAFFLCNFFHLFYIFLPLFIYLQTFFSRQYYYRRQNNSFNKTPFSVCRSVGLKKSVKKNVMYGNTIKCEKILSWDKKNVV